MEQRVIALCDANVLYAAPLRDLLIRLAQAGVIRLKWTDTIHEEWIRNVLLNNPHLTAKRLARTRSLMDGAVRDCLVLGYEHLIDSLELPDPDDRHVLAAAIAGGAEIIVTFNLADFPEDVLMKHGVAAIHPDELLAELLDSTTAAFCNAVKLQRASLRDPSRTVEELLRTFEGLGLVQTASKLKRFASRF